MRNIFNALDTTPAPDCATNQASYAANCVQIAASQFDIDEANKARNNLIKLQNAQEKIQKQLQAQIEPLSQLIIKNNNIIKPNNGTIAANNATIATNQKIIRDNPQGNPARVKARIANETLKKANETLTKQNTPLIKARDAAIETRSPLRKSLNTAQAAIAKLTVDIDAQEAILAAKRALNDSLRDNNITLAATMAAQTPPCAVTPC